jgi:hypothetical protein
MADGDGLRAFVFFPRGWMLRRDPRAPMLRGNVLRIEEGEVSRIA